MAELDFPENTQSQDGGWLGKIAKGITQVNQALELYSNMQTGTVNQAAGEVKRLTGPGGIDSIIQIVNQLGLGDKPIGELLQQISGFTPNQLKELGEKYAGNNGQSQE